MKDTFDDSLLRSCSVLLAHDVIDSPYGETFIEMGNYAQYHTAGSTIYVHDFDSMHLYGTEGGVNRIRRVHRLDAVYTTIGDWLMEYA